MSSRGWVLLALSLGFGQHVAAQDPQYELEGLVVTATPVPLSLESVATHVTVLDGSELRARGITELSEALRDVPGLHVARGGSFGAITSVFFRGGESDYTQVLVDGVQVNQPGGSFDFASLSLDNVERVEIVRGPVSALTGSDGVAGVIQIITRTGEGGPRGSLGFEAGPYDSRDVQADLSGGDARFGYGFSYARHRTDGILEFNNRHHRETFSGSVRLLPDERTRARLSVRLTDREYHFPTDGSGNLVDQNAFSFSDDLALSLDVSRFLGESLEVRALLTAHEFDGGSDDRPDGPADTLGFFAFSSLDDVRRLGADLRANAHLDDWVATLGAEFEDQSQRSFSESMSEFGPSASRSEENRSNRAVYAHLVGTRGGWAANAGVRVEDNEHFGGFVTYRLGASVEPWDGARVRASLGRGIKEPTFFEVFAAGFARGNPDLEPERSTSWEVGFDQDVAAGLRVSATYFDQTFRDLIQFTFSPPSPGDPNFFNVAEADAAGVELGLHADLGPVLLSGDYTWLDTEVIDSGFDSGEGATFVEGERLLRRPTHAFGLNATYRPHPRLSLNGTLRFVGERSDRDFSTFPATAVELDSYARVDVGAHAVVVRPEGSRPGFDLVLRAENLFDEEYQEVFGFDAPGGGLCSGLSMCGLYVGGRLTFGAR